jgi:2-keto-4-pentenoate hydratase
MTDLTQRLLAARASGDYSPAFLAGALDLGQALDLQLDVLQEHLDGGKTVGGWKVGLTSEASRTRLGADERPFGFVLAERTLASGDTVDSSAVQGLSVETEMCFTVGTDIGNTDITPDEIFDYVTGVAAGFELNETRPGSVRPDFYAMVTDCLTNWGIVAGTAVTPTSAAELSATEITMERNGEVVFSGVSRDFVDDHAESLCRLVEQLARHGQMLRAGQKVITGAFARFPTEPGDHWRANYSGIGNVDITII